VNPRGRIASALEEIVDGAVFRPRDVEPFGVHRDRLQLLAGRGEVERVARGLYRLASGEISEHFTVIAVCAKVPHAIVCLLTALHLHGLGTQIPHEVWIAIDRKARKPVLPELPARVVRFSGLALTCGVQEWRLDGVPIRITSPARTVVDCFRYRNKIGLDVALEALREALHGRQTSADEIARTAEALRMRTVIAPYLASLGT
jgi:predicted transcriptional regulator of viral defense system